MKIIGWQEYISLPNWSIRRICATMDTGALNSVLDVADIAVIANNRIRFELVYSRDERYQSQEIETIINRETLVRSSNGQLQKRYTILTTLALGDAVKTVEFSLISRKYMRNRVIIGRSAMADGFIIDPSKRFLLKDNTEDLSQIIL